MFLKTKNKSETKIHSKKKQPNETKHEENRPRKVVTIEKNIARQDSFDVFADKPDNVVAGGI